ncbi:zona pellucida sperm-binding protein 1 isoform X2 [Sciurus carolinensis]|uniref:zona pellucida sperm-binding protein 1 isoform X2 n=1 Tax=Sciurus carolinensis TaxID=30640 RepID=UPI001FB222EC|nr:zona pellucida sperm-binding protein 1 isoform X2 [Sciurus carolinensis]
MAWRFHVILPLLAAASLGLGGQRFPTPGFPGLQHSYDCGTRGMQLLVVPRPGQTIRFKVLDEFGNRFEVNNCSICYHWVTAEPRELAVFSADYQGCHVLQKDGRFHLRVFVEAVLQDGHVDVAQEATLICPKPDHTGTPDASLVPPATSWPSSPQLLPLRPTPSHIPPSPSYPEHSFFLPTPAPLSLGLGPSRPALTRPQWGTVGPWEVDQPESVGAHLPQEQCQVVSGHIPCVVRNDSKEACRQAGCCYDDSRDVPCYYGNTATVQCFRSGYFILVMSQEMALARRITLANIHLAYAPTHCPPTQKTSAFVVFRVPLTHCGTTVQTVGSQLIYENQLASDLQVQKGPQGSITRDGTFRLHVRCLFDAGDFLPLQASIFPPASPAPVAQSGPLRLELRIAKDETFRSYHGQDDYPLVRLLREPVHVEVRLLRRTDPRLVLVLHQCWATPGPNPFQQPQWPLLSDGCPFEGDSYRTQMVALDRADLPFQSHYQRFTVATFALLDFSSQRALRGLVYFFCSASACFPSRLEPCSPACASGTARQRRSPGHFNGTARPLDIVSSPGPVGFQDSYGWGPTSTRAYGSSRNSNPRPLLWVLLCCWLLSSSWGLVCLWA